jgi:hypothetical protein
MRGTTGAAGCLPARDRALERVASSSVEFNVQRSVLGPFYATLGAGYSVFGGSGPAGYGYWSAGAAYDRAALTLACSIVGVSTASDAFFYGAEPRKRLVATLIWRF